VKLLIDLGTLIALLNGERAMLRGFAPPGLLCHLRVGTRLIAHDDRLRTAGKVDPPLTATQSSIGGPAMRRVPAFCGHAARPQSRCRGGLAVDPVVRA
jgi:hypothetical protein